VAPTPEEFKALYDYSAGQLAWATQVAGITERNGQLRNTTAQCLDKYRTLGITR
jgi:hypothetical protein